MKKRLFCIISIVLMSILCISMAEDESDITAGAWKNAPEITFASQTADGEVTLQWDHDDCGTGCEYAIIKINKVLGVMTGEEQLGTTKEHKYIIHDLPNGNYCINIVPVFNNEKGSYSVDSNIEVKNEWVVAPELTCEYISDSNQIRLAWTAPASIETYHITVYTGDNASLLKLLDLDYRQYIEFDVPSIAGEMEYIYAYDEYDAYKDIRLKFEIMGIRYSLSGEEQKSAVSSKSITIKGKKAITMHKGSADFTDETLEKVNDYFVRHGFTNIESEKVCFDDKGVWSDHVVTVTINGSKFSRNDQFPEDAKVLIQYRNIYMYDNKTFDRAYSHKTRDKGHVYTYILVDDDTCSVYEFKDIQSRSTGKSHRLTKSTFDPAEGYTCSYSIIPVDEAISEIRKVLLILNH